MRFRGQKAKNFASHHFSSLAENDAERQLDEKYSGSSFPLILPPEYQQLAVKNPFQFWLETTFPISPRKLLKWHQEEVSEGQDEKTPGEREREREGEIWESEGRDDRRRGGGGGITTEIETGERKWELKKERRRWRGRKTEGNRIHERGWRKWTHSSTTHPCPLPF